MFGLIKFLISIAVIAALVWGAYWYLTTPQPPKFSAQVAYFKDTVQFNYKMYRQPKVEKSIEKLEQLRPLVEKGNMLAEIRAAQIMFVEGAQDPQNYRTALPLLQYGVKMGIPLAQNAFGVAVRDGLGGLQADRVEAYKWFKLAAMQDLKLAKENALALSRQMTITELNEANRRAEAWLAAYQKE